MKKLKLPSIVILAALAGIAGWLQERTRARLEVEVAALATRSGEVARAAAANHSLEAQQLTPDQIAFWRQNQTELLRLRTEQETADAAAVADKFPVTDSGSVFQPKRIATGDLKVRAEWRNVGYATPEAAFETAHWAGLVHDIDVTVAGWALDEGARAKARETFDRLPEDTRAKYGTPGRMLAMLDGGGAEHAGFKVLDVIERSPGYVVLHTLWQWDDGRMRENTGYDLRDTGDGWRIPITADDVEESVRPLALPPLVPMPSPDQFDATFFTPNQASASNQDLANASLLIVKAAQSINTYLAYHSGLRTQMNDLETVATNLLKDSGSDAAASADLQARFASLVTHLETQTETIATRSTESREAVATTRQIQNLVAVLKKRLPPAP